MTEPKTEPDTAPDVEDADVGETVPQSAPDTVIVSGDNLTVTESEDDGSTTDHGEED
jgi:hypothetical protein